MIHFKIQSKDDEFTSYISIEDPTDDLENMISPDEIVIDKASIRITYDYPLSQPVTFVEVATTSGFSRRDLVLAICNRYKSIYEEEEASSEIPVGNIPGMFNRVRTNGKYGIWARDPLDPNRSTSCGHCIGDLVLHSVEYDQKTGAYYLGIDS